MNLADLLTQANSVLPSYGLAGLVILSLAIAAIKLYRDLSKERDRNDNIQAQRLIDAKETRDKLTEPLAQNARMSEQIYELLLNSRRGK